MEMGNLNLVLHMAGDLKIKLAWKSLVSVYTHWMI